MALQSDAMPPKASRRDRIPYQQDHQVRPNPMKLTYDPSSDTLTIELREAPITESDESRPGLILDYGADGEIVGIEILDASKRVENPSHIDFRAAG